MPILVHFKAKNNDNSYFYNNYGLSFQWVPYYVNSKFHLLLTCTSGHFCLLQITLKSLHTVEFGSGSEPFDTLIVFQDECLKKVTF